MYVYEQMKPKLFTDEGLRLFTKVRDRANHLLNEAKAFRMDAILSSTSGDSWQVMACVDRMIEEGEIRELTVDTCGQYRVFIRK